jgi:diaminopimelate decarboxylase
MKNSLADQLVGECFGVAGGVLTVGGRSVADLVARHGSPLYVYDGAMIATRWRALQAAVEGFARVYYSIKANPNPAVARLLAGLGAGLEVASGGELAIALGAGAPADRILFAGPGKTEAELAAAVAAGCGEVHLETFEEMALLGAIARRAGRDVAVALRINPRAEAQGGAMRMGGKPAPFGFDEETLDEVLARLAAEPRLHLTGIHLFAGTQILQAGVLIAQWRHGLSLAADVARRLGRPLQRIDLGGGLGIPYHQGDATLDLAEIAFGAAALAAERARQPLLADAEVVLEPGRYLVGPAGVYLMRVLAVKVSRGQRFVICDGGMHHHLAASGNLGQVIKRDYPVLAATRMADGARTPASVVGPLCTPLDTLARNTALPPVAAGDIVAVLQSGAYGLSASPVGFLGHPTPAELLVHGGEETVVRPRGDATGALALT